MTTQKKQKQRQRCKIMEAIKTIEEAASTATKIYRCVEPLVKAVIKNWGRIK